MKNKMVLTALLLSVFAFSAQANTVTYSGNASGTGSTLNFGVTQFSSSLGTLTGVSLSVDAYQTLTFKLTNVGAADNWVIEVANGKITLNDSFSSTDHGFTYSETLPVAADGDTFVSPETSTSFSKTYGAESAFVGNSTLVMAISYAGSWYAAEGLNENGDGILRTATSRSLDWSVTYTYDVPEPTSMALLALGVAALGLRRKHGKSI